MDFYWTKSWQNTPLCSATDGKAKSTEKDSSDDQKKKQKDEVGVSKVFGTYKLIYLYSIDTQWSIFSKFHPEIVDMQSLKNVEIVHVYDLVLQSKHWNQDLDKQIVNKLEIIRNCKGLWSQEMLKKVTIDL